MKTGHFGPRPIDLRDCPHEIGLEAEFGDSYANLTGGLVILD